LQRPGPRQISQLPQDVGHVIQVADDVGVVRAAACARHMVIVGATGSGKTNLMIRLWA